MVLSQMPNFSSKPPSYHPGAGMPHEDARHTTRGVRSFVDGIMSPFVSCWQPPVNACVAPSSCHAPSHRYREDYESASSPAVVSPLVDRRAGYNKQHGYHEESIEVPHNEHAYHPGGGAAIAGVEAPQPTANIKKPHSNDVLCGRGGSSNRHHGNMNFRELVAANKKTYVGLTKKQKMMVARKIVELVHETSPPGRFLAKDIDSGLWYDIGLPRSLEKTSQALREKNSNDMPASQTQNAIELSPDRRDGDTDDGKGKNGKRVEAPPIVVPSHLKDVYCPSKSHPSPSKQQSWSDYPPTSSRQGYDHHYHHHRHHREQPSYRHSYPPLSPSSTHSDPYSGPPRSPSYYTESPPPYHHGQLPPDRREHYDHYSRHRDHHDHHRDHYGTPTRSHVESMGPPPHAAGHHHPPPPLPHHVPHNMPTPHSHIRGVPPLPSPHGGHSPAHHPRPAPHHPPVARMSPRPLHHGGGDQPPSPIPSHASPYDYDYHHYRQPRTAVMTPPDSPTPHYPPIERTSSGTVRGTTDVSPGRRQERKRQRNLEGVARRLSDQGLSSAMENGLTLTDSGSDAGSSTNYSRIQNIASPSGVLQSRSHRSLKPPVEKIENLKGLSGLDALSKAAQIAQMGDNK